MSEIDFNKANREWAELQVQTGIPETPPSSPECDHCGKPMPEGYEVVNYNGKVGRLHSECVDATPPPRPERVPFVNDGTKPCSACGDGDTDKKYHVHVFSPEQEAREWYENWLQTRPHRDATCSLGVIGLLAAYAAHIRQQQREQDWIPVSDRLPEEPDPQFPHTTVTVEMYDHAANYWQGFLDLDTKDWWIHQGHEDDAKLGTLYNITHWRPLPAPPIAAAIRSQEGM